MPDELHEDQLPPEKPKLKASLSGYAFAVAGAILLALVIGLVLRWWG